MSRPLTFAALLRLTASLLVADNSPCATNCGNVLDATTPDMIVCDDTSYSLTSAGQVFESCITCESTSAYGTTTANKSESDLNYMLYNMRYATAKCLFDAGTSPCITSRACEPFKNAIEYANLSTNVLPYGYCQYWSDFFLDQCRDCLINGEDYYVDNYIGMLSGACRLQLELPATLPFEGGIFSTDQLNVTDPTATAQVSSGQKGPLNNGEIAGVVIGGVVIILAVLGCCVVFNGKRKRKAYLRRRSQISKNWPSPGTPGFGEMFETPISQRPLRGWEDSPISAHTQTTFSPYFSPYASQFNSPVSAVEGPRGQGHNFAAWPVEKAQHMEQMHSPGYTDDIGVAISPDHEDSENRYWGDRKGKEPMSPEGVNRRERDEYELQEGVNSAGGYNFPVPPTPTSPPPTLSHPGYGRYGPPLQSHPVSKWEEHHHTTG
ncbi:hypothetical protein F5Y15DRAFT_422804 [Xylariaceae sp. FL0016]|nr:hypothetical protein F5Y15DRAFT_422804 [Xylariaceae sp. FL0016]